MSAWRVAPESTGVVPLTSLEPVPLPVRVQSVATAVPPLSLTTFLRRWSCGGMSLLVIVQVAVWPMPTVTDRPTWVPPTQT